MAFHINRRDFFRTLGHRVPCFIRGPNGDISAGADIDRLTAHIDLLPTLIGLCGIDSPAGVKFDGASLAPLLRDKDAEWPDRVLVTNSQRVEHPRKWKSCSVMTDRWRLINGTALYDIHADPKQENNVAADHPDLVARLRAEYEEWWTSVSERFGEYCEIILGSEHENPSKLSSHDWHKATRGVPWNQEMVRRAPDTNGFWSVEIARDGVYEFALRRWPEELDEPILAESSGKAIQAEKARIKIADVDQTKPVQSGDKAVRFEISLKAGHTRLQTWFEGSGVKSRGAYYVYVTRKS